jgi:quercetin dioxygenase-like cupin family protein
MSAFADLVTEVPLKIWDGVLGRAVHGDRLTLSLIELDAETVIPEHSHESEQAGFVVEGSVTFRVADETRVLGPAGAWCITANTPHEVHAGPQGVVVVEAFCPSREDWHHLERDEPRLPRWPER